MTPIAPVTLSEHNSETVVTLAAEADLGIPRPGMQLDAEQTAIVITDPPERLSESARCDLGCRGRERY